MGHALLKDDYLTPEDYLWREQQSIDVKHEYVNGRIYAMAGANRKHHQMGASKNRHEQAECQEPRSESPRHIK